MKGLKNYNLKFERIKIWNIHIKTKHVPGVIGDSRWPKYHPKIAGLHIPPKNFVCCIPNAVSQTKRSVDPRGMKQHNTSILDEINENTLRWIKAVSQLNVYHFSQQNENNDDNDKNNENNEK